MARRLLFLVLVTTLLAAPARAHTRPTATEVTFDGAIPCAIACAYWVDNGFTPCEMPFPPGSYDDVATTPAPTPGPGKIVVFEATLDPEVDWDLFLCANDETRRELAQGGGWGPCEGPLGDDSLAPLGCHEDASTPVTAGQTVIMRAYNWSDPLPATGYYWFLEI